MWTSGKLTLEVFERKVLPTINGWLGHVVREGESIPDLKKLDLVDVPAGGSRGREDRCSIEWFRWRVTIASFGIFN